MLSGVGLVGSSNAANTAALPLVGGPAFSESSGPLLAGMCTSPVGRVVLACAAPATGLACAAPAMLPPRRAAPHSTAKARMANARRDEWARLLTVVTWG